MKKFLIYSDEGSSSRCIRSLVLSLRQEGSHSIKLVNHRDLLNDAWHQEAQAIIFPGGRDVPYHQALQGKANSSIREFVHEGGIYIGICAGGYYGASSVEFEKGTPLEIIEERQLRFFPGIARGPAYGTGQFCYESERGARIASLHISSPHSPLEAASAYYNGGCMFVDADLYPNVHILARYIEIPQRPAAIIQCSVGKGKAILSGVHPEYSGYHKHIKEPHLIHILQEKEQERIQLFRHLLSLM